MAIKDKDRKARANYRKKLKRVQFDVFPTTEADIQKKLDEIKAQGEPIAAYIKRLIRQDIAKEKQ